MLSLPCRKLWAKSDPYHPLWCHLLDVAAVCQALLPRFGGLEVVPEAWTLYLVALHDIGKADARFVGKAPILDLTSLLPAPFDECVGFRHEARSAEWLETHLPQRFGWSIWAAAAVAAAVRGHHGNFSAGERTGEFYREQGYSSYYGFYAPLREELAEMLRSVLDVPPLTVSDWDDSSAVGMKLSGLIVLADWIASNPETYHYNNPARLDTSAAPKSYWQAARQEAHSAVQRLGLDANSPLPQVEPPTFAAVWPGLAPRPLQSALEALCLHRRALPGLAIVEAPMGEGKTEAALYLARCWARAGAYIALPTQATSNQMFERYRKFLPEAAAPRLVHGMAWLLDENAPDDVSRTESEDADEPALSREWFAPTKRALLATNGVGTVDQVLMAALRVKHGFLRLLGLAAKVLIIDEVHAYDAYMNVLLCRLLEWCRCLHVPVILLSATLSYEQKRRLTNAYAGSDAPNNDASSNKASLTAAPEDYPLLTFAPLEGAVFAEAVPTDPERARTLHLARHPGLLDDAEGVARLALTQVENGGCACVLVNTVGFAQKVFRELQALKTGDAELLLFHARFRAEQRQEIEKRVLARFGKDAGTDRPFKAVLIATQVVEQSLDVDFDFMLTQIAPIDLLLQRSGRLHRHAPVTRSPEDVPVLHIMLPQDGEFDFGSMEVKQDKKGNWRGVYDRAALLRTVALLQARNVCYLPTDFRSLIEGCYGSALPRSTFPAELIQRAEQDRDARRAGSERNAEVNIVPFPDTDEFQYGQQRDFEAEADEGERATWFRLSTREGDDSRAVLVLHDPSLVKLVERGLTDADFRPDKTRLRRLLLQKVGLPTWWLAGAVPDDGFVLLRETPRWLRHTLVLSMQDRAWRGRDKDGRAVVITDDDQLGLLRSAEE